MAFLTGYTKRRKLTIDHSKIDSNLSDFPMLVKLTSANFVFADANSDGFDIRFTSSDGETLLKYERERHDNANSLAEYWVKVPTVESSEATYIYIYYKDTDTADGADPTNVWDSNFGLVYHLKDDPDTSNVQDSTSNNFDGTKTGANQPIEENSIIAKGQDFDGSNDRIYSPYNPFSQADFATNGATLECFFKTPGTGDPVRYIVSLEGYLLLALRQTTGIVTGSSSGFAEDVVGYSSCDDDVWYHAVITWNPDGTPTAKLYIDGIEEDSSASNGPALTTGRPFSVGNHSTDAGFFLGSVDEVRISTTCRTVAWVKASNESGRHNLLSYGSEEGKDPTIKGINTIQGIQSITF